MNALDLHHTIFTSEKASDLPLRSASSFLHPAPERDESPTSQLFGTTAYQDLIQRQPTHPSGPMSGWDLGLNLLGDPITAEEYKNLKDYQTKMKLRRLHAVNTALELLFGIWATYITVRYFVGFADGSGERKRVCALVLGILSALVVAFVTVSFMMPLFPQEGHPDAWRRTRSLLRASYLLLLCAGPVMNLVLVIVWHPSQFCGWDIDIAWYTSAMNGCRPAPFGAWIAAAIVRLAVTWAIVFLFIFALRSYHEIRHPSERTRPQYSPYFSSDPEEISPPKSKLTRSDDGHVFNRSHTTLPKYTSISTLAPSTSCTGQSRSPPNDISRKAASRSDMPPQTQSVNVTLPSLPHTLRHKSRISLQTVSDPDLSSPHESSPSETSACSRPTHVRKTSTAWESARSVSTSCSSCDTDEHAYGYGASLPTYPYLDLYNPSEERRTEPSEESSGESEYVAMMGGYVRRMATIESLGSREASAASPLSSVRFAGTMSSAGAVVGAASATSQSTAYLSFSSVSGVNERGELRSGASSPMYFTATSGTRGGEESGSGCSLPG